MLSNQVLQEFLNVLASQEATPGGGSVAALNGAMGAALVSMVCRVTIGKKKYAAVEAEMQTILEQAEALRRRLTDLMTADAEAFGKVMAAFALPRQTDAQKAARREAIQSAFKEATRIPLETARACAEVLTLCRPVAEKGNVNALSDVGTGAQVALAGLRGAALNVHINLASIRDEAFVSEKEAELNTLLAKYPPLADEVYRLVQSKM